MTEEEKEKIINTFNNAWSRKIASENSHGKLASKEMFENKEEIISGIQNDEHTVRFNQHLFDQSTIKIYQDEIARLEQERDEIQERILTLADTYQETRNVCKRLEQENKELSFAIEKCLENAGIECDDEEQALRSLPMLGNAHYKVLVEKEELKQENKKLKYLISEEQCFEEGCNKCTKAYYTDDKYRSALEEINRVVKLAHKVEDYLLGQDYTDLVDRIEKEINEVLQ